ncbi:MAG: phosphoribosylaminoimidazolesuccinocarboxamide synthase [Candidatus Adiutrix sp.]|jgi:phosphoribosylaminoimidazole-succinocarboxamide synthase|nr:phosphoribosylaminoimidazolesuccinocarboxamide synthase [Candidatus Adiutrix sp.]
MKLVKNGKTKDVYQLENGRYLLKFKDSVTGGPGGVVDPGGNSVVGEQAGMGRACLAMTSFIFGEAARRGLAETHMGAVNLDESTMEVVPARPFGQGLEVIVRFVATGSFVRRYGLYAEDGRRFSAPLVEITLKDDERGDPLANDETLVELGLATLEEIAKIKAQARSIAGLIQELGQKNGLDIFDLKMEFGRSAEGKLLLIDEISPGSMRAYKGGQRLQGPELAQAFTA